MALRDEASYKSAKNTRFADNTTGNITAANGRDMEEDAADSFMFHAGNIVSVSTASNITFNFTDHFWRVFVGSASIGANKTVSFSNASNACEFKAFLSFSGTYYLEFPSGTKCDSEFEGGIWNNSNKRLTLDAGNYIIKGEFDGTNWWISVKQYTS